MFWWEPLPGTEFDDNYGPLYAEPAVYGVSQGVSYGTPVDASALVYIVEDEVATTNHINIIEPTGASSVISVVPRYEIATDQGYIMIQSITQDYFRSNIKKFIPYEYWRKDANSIQDGGGEGDLENFMEVFALTLDEIKQAIDEFVWLFDIDHCPPKYLQVIAELLNYPLEAVDSTDEQRKQLKSAIEWYKSKGARQGFISILYAFGYYAEVIPLWTQNIEDNPYEVFTESIPGISRGNDPPNDYPLLIENGGTWFRSPHYGIRLKAIIGDKHASIYWDTLTPGELPVTDELVSTAPDSVITSFAGTVANFPLFAGTLEGRTEVLGAPVDIVDDGVGGLSGTSYTATTVDHTPDGVLTSFGTDVSGDNMYSPIELGSVTIRGRLTGDVETLIVDDGVGGLSDVANSVTGTINYVTGEWHVDFGGVTAAEDSFLEALYTTEITGTIDYDNGQWSLDFGTPPSLTGDIIFDYTYDFFSLVDEIGYHRAFYQCVDLLGKAGAGIQYKFDADDFRYMFRRLEFLRPVFAVLDWIEHGLEMYEGGPIPDEPDSIMTVNPTRSEKGWYLGYCDLDDIQYTRLDERLLGQNPTALPPQLPGSASTVPIVGEVIESVSSVITQANGVLANQWIYSGVEITILFGATPYLVVDNGEGVLIGEDATVYGLIDYITGGWELIFEGVNPDNPSDITIDYVYTTEVPPTDRSGAFPRGSTALPYPHLRNPQEGYCHPPEELFIDWYWLPEEPYTLPLTRDGMNLYPPAGPVTYIDHADFPSRGFTNALGDAGHANTFTREYGYSTRPLSLLKVVAEAVGVPEPDAENWENQNTHWESWTGPWETIGD